MVCRHTSSGTEMTSLSRATVAADRSAATLNNPSSLPNSLTVKSMSPLYDASSLMSKDRAAARVDRTVHFTTGPNRRTSTTDAGAEPPLGKSRRYESRRVEQRAGNHGTARTPARLPPGWTCGPGGGGDEPPGVGYQHRLDRPRQARTLVRQVLRGLGGRAPGGVGTRRAGARRLLQRQPVGWQHAELGRRLVQQTRSQDAQGCALHSARPQHDAVDGQAEPERHRRDAPAVQGRLMAGWPTVGTGRTRTRDLPPMGAGASYRDDPIDPRRR